MVAQALWHLSLPPSSEIPFLVHHDIQITNASLTASLADENARSVVTMTFQPTNPRELDGEESDDEDEDDFSGMEDDEEDEEDEAELEAFAAAAAAAAGKKSPKSKSNGTPSELAAATDDAEDEEEDSDEDSSISLTEEPVTSTLCALTPGKIEGITLNLILNEDEVVIFKNEGKNEIHLLGNYIDQIPFRGGRDDFDDMENDSESEYSYDSDEEGPLDFGEDGEGESGDSEMEGMDIDMEDLQRVISGGKPKKGKKGDSHRFEIVDEEESKPKSKKSATAAAAATTPVAAPTAAVDSKKRKADAASTSTPEKAQAEGGKKLKNDKGEGVPSKKGEEKKDKPVEKKAEKKAEKPEKQSSKKVTHPSGLTMEDVKVGDGPVAGKGKRCGMRYIGKLQNGKQFDANTAGAPFTFRLGAGEVIKGWDIGVAGMKVGGERKLTIPANLAYGNQKIPGIPANSTLVFDIKLVNVK